MKILATLNNISTMNTRDFNDPRTGEVKAFHWIDMTFSQGKDRFYGQCAMENADALMQQQVEQNMLGKLCWVQGNFSTRDYTDKEGKTRCELRLTVTTVTPCW